MSQVNTSISEHYLGNRGKLYFSSKFGSHMDFGRSFQSHYFLPYCKPHYILLDFGCADGLFLRNLPAREKIGVEANPVARQRCQDISLKLMDQIKLYETLAEIQSSHVDLVISNHCLEHVLNPFITLQEILRVLKPGGQFVLMVPFDDYRNSQNKRWRTKDPNNHLYTWSPMNLGNLLQEAGFEVQEIDLHIRAWSPKLFWIHSLFGKSAFKIFCYLLGMYKRRQEVFARCIKKRTN